ncbi:hypothetical protein Ahy_B03g065444 [Arachis hypogaea]|uniref:SWIM-type domain-containing protein n=1 Tax=Arachis hypogaea TaxID=3818 RepID=A0A445A1N2_ARAHY|nr:hypothetical protein Ahy_B03g065444 [Arachis hypogaea]
MRVTHCDRRASIFVIEELKPFEGWFQGSFRVRLTARMCDCGLFQSLNFPCHHALAACAIANEALWPEWYGTWLHPNPLMRKKATGRPVSIRFRNFYTGKSGILGEVVPTDPRTKLRWLFPF